MNRFVQKLVTCGLLLISASSFADTFTATQSGAWSAASTWGGSAPPFTILVDNVVIPSGINVTLDGNLTIDGLLAQLNVNGQLIASGSQGIVISQGLLTGSGEVDVHSMEFGLTSNSTFIGTMNADLLTSGSSNLLVSGSTNVAETLHLEGGNITIASGETLTVASGGMIIAEAGSLQGTGSFMASGTYNVLYNGEGMTAGKELMVSTLNDVTVNLDNASDEVEMDSDVTINGMLRLSSGYFDLNGNNLILEGDLTVNGTAALRSNESSTIYVYSASSLSSALTLDPNANDLDRLIIEFDNNGGEADFDSDVRVVSEVRLANGDMRLTSGNSLMLANNALIWINDGSFNMESGSVFDTEGTLQLKYTGSSKSSGVELNGNSVSNFELNLIDNDQWLTLNNNLEVNTAAYFESGQVALNGQEMRLNGFIGSNANADIMLDGDEDASLWLSGAISSDMIVRFRSQDTLSTLVINYDEDAADQIMEFDGNLYIRDMMRLDDGRALFYDNNLFLYGNAVMEGGSEASYIMTSGTARLVMWVDGNNSESVEFPLGDADGYAPVRLQNGAAGNVQFAVKEYSVVYYDGTSGYAINNSEPVVNKTWDIDADASAAIDIDMEVQWMENMEVNGFDRTEAYISHYIDGGWDTYAASSAQATGSGSYSLSRTSITSLSPFSVQNEGAVGIEVAATTNGDFLFYPNPVRDQLSIESNGTLYDLIRIYDLSGKLIHQETITGAFNRTVPDLRSLKEGIYMLSISNNGQVVATERIVKI